MSDYGPGALTRLLEERLTGVIAAQTETIVNLDKEGDVLEDSEVPSEHLGESYEKRLWDYHKWTTSRKAPGGLSDSIRKLNFMNDAAKALGNENRTMRFTHSVQTQEVQELVGRLVKMKPGSEWQVYDAVSYTHLTLPTKRIV